MVQCESRPLAVVIRRPTHQNSKSDSLYKILGCLSSLAYDALFNHKRDQPINNVTTRTHDAVYRNMSRTVLSEASNNSVTMFTRAVIMA